MKRHFLTITLLFVAILTYSQTLYVPAGTSGIGTSGNRNVGIGISTPEQKLSINGGLRIARSQDDLYHLDIVPNVISSGNVRYDFLVTDYGDTEDETILSLNGQSGMVGIGTVNPQAKLHISGGLRHGGTGEINIDAPYIIGGRFKIMDNGNVGIGITDPEQKLNINGGVRIARSEHTPQMLVVCTSNQ